MHEESSTGSTIAKVAMRVPPFWKRSPDLWFYQLEAQFNTNGITRDETKFYTLVGNLDADILTEVRDIIRTPPESEKYDAIKKQMLLTFQESQQNRLKKLLNDTTLDGRRPTQLLKQMQELASGCISEDVLRTLWLQRLSSQTQAILAVSTEQNITLLAQLADGISEVLSTSEIAASSTSLPEPSTSDLLQKIVDLEKQIKQLTRRDRSPSRSNSHGRDKRRSGRTLCWYHSKFGNDAKRCQQPCSHQGN